MTYEQIDAKADRLLDAAACCNDENSEWWSKLAGLVPSYRDAASESFADAIEAEIESEHKRLLTDFTIEVNTITQSRTVRQLVRRQDLL